MQGGKFMRLKKFGALVLSGIMIAGTLGTMNPMSVMASEEGAGVSTAAYTMEVPAGLNITKSGWNQLDGAISITRSGDNNLDKAVTVTATSDNGFHLVSDQNKIKYTLKAEDGGEEKTTFEFSADDINNSRASQTLGVDVADFSSAVTGTYTDTIKFEAEMETSLLDQFSCFKEVQLNLSKGDVSYFYAFKPKTSTTCVTHRSSESCNESADASKSTYTETATELIFNLYHANENITIKVNKKGMTYSISPSEYTFDYLQLDMDGKITEVELTPTGSSGEEPGGGSESGGSSGSDTDNTESITDIYQHWDVKYTVNGKEGRVSFDPVKGTDSCESDEENLIADDYQYDYVGIRYENYAHELEGVDKQVEVRFEFQGEGVDGIFFNPEKGTYCIQNATNKGLQLKSFTVGGKEYKFKETPYTQPERPTE